VARLVGVCEAAIVEAVSELLHDEDAYAAMAQPANPYGDGLAAYRAARAVEALLGCGARAEDFAPTMEIPLPPVARGDLDLGRAPEGART
jgi:UDP-N-acetylglucosamine 2-epimerase (non-hydrolysing)